MTQPDIIDLVASYLTRLLHSILCVKDSPLRRDITRPRFVTPYGILNLCHRSDYYSGVARRIFWKHLFPPFEKDGRSEYSRPILETQSRGMLIEIIFSLIGDDSTQLTWLLEDLNEILPLFPEEEGEYFIGRHYRAC